MAEVGEDLPPDGPVFVDGPFAGDGDVVGVADVDESGGPGEFDSGHAGGEFREVLDVLRAGDGDAFWDVEGDAGFEEERAGEVGARFEGDCAAFGRGGVDGLLDCGGLQSCPVADRAAVDRENGRGCGQGWQREGGRTKDQREESGGTQPHFSSAMTR